MNNRATPELLERLLDGHGAALRLFASQWTESPDDCVQEALLQLVRQPTLPERIVPWLYRVVRNQAISLRRASLRRARHETAAAIERQSWFSVGGEALVDPECLTKALQSLAENHREVIVAKIWGRLTFEQIAEVLGISRSSAHRLYEAGLHELRERLKRLCRNKDEITKSTPSSAN